MNPHAASQEHVKPGHVHGHGCHAVARSLHRVDQLLAQVLTHERIAGLHELR